MSQECWTKEAELPSDVVACKQILDEILAELAGQEWFDPDIFAIHLALEEALVNAVKHGNRLDQSKKVRVACKITPDRIWVKVADEGEGFEPDCVPDCTQDENLTIPSGRGIMLMRNFMCVVEYNEQGNCVVMEKRRAEKS